MPSACANHQYERKVRWRGGVSEYVPGLIWISSGFSGRISLAACSSVVTISPNPFHVVVQSTPSCFPPFHKSAGLGSAESA